MPKQISLLVLLFAVPMWSQTNNSAIIYADQYTSLTYQQIADTICPASGCTIYATSSNASTTIGTLDVGAKPVTIYLGPFQYNIDHIILRTGFRMIGMGAAYNGTILQSINANSPLFLIPQANNTAETDVYLYGLRMYAEPSNTTQAGIWIDCSQLTTAGLWHSSFEDLYFQGFKGSAMGFFGPINNANAANQFLSFRNIWATRPMGGGPDLRMEGYNAQVDCIECHFDGFGPTGDGWANVSLGNTGGSYNPSSIHFINMTNQGANIGVQLSGAEHITFIGSHLEGLNGAFQLQSNGTVSTRGVMISNTYFAGNVGKTGDHNGFLVNAISATVVTLQAPIIDGSPDFVVAGASSQNVKVY